MKKNGRRVFYTVLVWALFLGGAAFDVVMLASALGLAPLNLLEPTLRESDTGSIFFIIISAVALALGGALVYAVSLDPFGGDRPWGLVYLNVLPVSGYLAALFIFFNIGFHNAPGPLDIAIAVGLAFGAPLIVFAVETMAARVLLSLGRNFDERGWRGAAYFFLKNSLRWRPSVHETARRCGLLLVESGRFRPARGLLERLGDPATSEDLPVMEALERVYVAEREGALALACLKRQGFLNPKAKDLDQRILDQCVALEDWAGAVDILESGRLTPSLDRLAMLQELHARAGDYDKALICARKLAEKEPAPYPRATSFLAALLEKRPTNIELLIELGLLLQKTAIADLQERGADLLEKALILDPARPSLRRLLAAYYTRIIQPDRAAPQLKRLVEEGDNDPQSYLGYAEILRGADDAEGALGVYRRMREILKEDWRGYVNEAETLYSLERMDEAEALLREAEPLVPENERLRPNILASKIRQRREELNLSALTHGLEDAGADAQKRLDYVRQLMAMDRGEQAVDECDALLQINPDMAGTILPLLEESVAKVTHSFRIRDYLADIYFRQGRYDDALAMHREMAANSLHPEKVLEQGCRKILARKPDHLAARLDLVEACMKMESWGAAVEALVPLIEDPPEAEALRIKAQWTEAAWRVGRAREAGEMGLGIAVDKRDNLPFLLMLIRILEDAGDFERAFDVYRLAQESFPDDDGLRRMKRAVSDNKQRQRMEELLAMEAKGGLSTEQRYEKADLHREFGQVHQAIVDYQRAADDPELVDIALAKLAICLCDRRLFDIANETMEKIQLTKETVTKRPELKAMFYWVADTMEIELYKADALKYFKRLFHVDAAFRDVVVRLEKLDSR